MKKNQKAKKVKKNNLVIIPSPVSSSISIAIASELADDQMIESEMMGEVLPFFIYKFRPEKDKPEVIGLTVKGVNEVVRRLGRNPKSGSKIRINPDFLTKEEVVRDGEKGIEVSVYAEDLVSGNSAWGIKFEAYSKVGRNGPYKNTFAVEKALAKAERNAKRKLISEVMATRIIQKLIKENPANVKQLEAPKFIDTAVKPSKPIPSSVEELLAVVFEAIEQSKTTGQLMKISEGAIKSAKLTSEQKEQITKKCLEKAKKLKEKTTS